GRQNHRLRATLLGGLEVVIRHGHLIEVDRSKLRLCRQRVRDNRNIDAIDVGLSWYEPVRILLQAGPDIRRVTIEQEWTAADERLSRVVGSAGCFTGQNP